jgi:signal transduction histidine kinase
MPNDILKKARVLVIDDEASNVRLLERILEMYGCSQVRSTTDPRESVKLFVEMEPDIVLLDLHMPHLDGFAVMEHLAQVMVPENFVPIIVLTADITVDTKRKALAGGAKDLVTKPIDHSEVILRIKNLLENRYLHQEVQRKNEMLEEQVRERTHQLEETLAELKAAQEREVKQERLSALGMMASGIAHDFNNALTMVLGYSELLLPYLQEQAPKKERDFMHNVISAAQDATHVVARLREFYRPLDGNEIRVAVNLNDVVTQTVSLTSPKWSSQRQAAGVQVRVATELHEELPNVLASAAELRETLTNLVFNAVDAMPSGGEITIRTQVEGDRVILSVSDTGIGMTDEERQRCLEPFFSTKGDRGTGLGLSVVYGIIQRHGGTIDIRSEKLKGTTFVINLPATTAEQTAAEEKEAEVQGTLRILVVDDQEIICELISEYLQSDGHETVSTTSATHALELFAQCPFDLVITDQSMPEINGVQLATSVRSMAPQTPVILLTGFGDEMQAQGLPEGVDLVLGKPVSMAGLRHAVFTVVTAPPLDAQVAA